MIFYLDTETTGLFDAEMVECSVIDDSGKTILDTLVDPGRPIPKAATAIHGITDTMVAGAPPADAVRAFVMAIVKGHQLVIYNAAYDTMFFPGIDKSAAKIRCCMLRAAPHFGAWDEYHESWRWPKLGVAAAGCGYVPEEGLHRALADARACRAVWHWLHEDELKKQA